MMFADKICFSVRLCVVITIGATFFILILDFTAVVTFALCISGPLFDLVN